MFFYKSFTKGWTSSDRMCLVYNKNKLRFFWNNEYMGKTGTQTKKYNNKIKRYIHLSYNTKVWVPNEMKNYKMIFNGKKLKKPIDKKMFVL